jgi:hypothetical protein
MGDAQASGIVTNLMGQTFKQTWQDARAPREWRATRCAWVLFAVCLGRPLEVLLFYGCSDFRLLAVNDSRILDLRLIAGGDLCTITAWCKAVDNP